jgi:O-methyltransferase involved in polyketide biosynthesis
MGNGFSHEKISVTARLVAYYRQFSDIPFSKEVAMAIAAEDTFKTLVRENNLDAEQLLEFAPIMEVRYKSIVNQIINAGMQQVLELASGFSLRGFAMTRNLPLAYVDTDLDQLTAEKDRLVSRLALQVPATNGGVYKNIAANALDPEDLHRAAAALRYDQPLVVVCEGLLQYFTLAERKVLFRNVRNLFSQFHGGVWLTPDLTTKDTAENVSEERKRMRRIVTGMTERTLYDGAFANEEEMNMFFAECGFSATVVQQMDLAPNLVSVEKLSLRPVFMERAGAKLKLWQLKPI